MQTMKTVLMRDNRVHVEEVPVPEPGTGQVLVKSRACGICGSDLHITLHAQEIFEFFKEVGTLEPDRSTDGMAISLGHEFCAEVVSYGPHTRRQLAVASHGRENQSSDDRQQRCTYPDRNRLWDHAL